MFSALAVVRQCTGVQVVDPEQKVYVPPMFHLPDHHSLPYFKDTNDDVEPSYVVDSESAKQPARRTSPRKTNSKGSNTISKMNINPKQKSKQNKSKGNSVTAEPKASTKKPI